jgi:DNA repair protein RadC
MNANLLKTEPICQGLCLSEDAVIHKAKTILAGRFVRSHYLTSPNHTRDYLTMCLAEESREIFGLVLLDNQHGVLDFKVLFQGTIDGASIYTREIVKIALEANAASVILAHNHPSGVSEPSTADQRITDRIKNALGTVDIRVLDHLIIGGSTITSFVEQGLL